MICSLLVVKPRCTIEEGQEGKEVHESLQEQVGEGLQIPWASGFCLGLACRRPVPRCSPCCGAWRVSCLEQAGKIGYLLIYSSDRYLIRTPFGSSAKSWRSESTLALYMLRSQPGVGHSTQNICLNANCTPQVREALGAL